MSDWLRNGHYAIGLRDGGSDWHIGTTNRNECRQCQPARQPDDLTEAWRRLDAAVRRAYPGKSFGIAADGPGYVAWVGGEERDMVAWSVADPELVGDPDHPSSPAKAADKLIALLDAKVPA